MSQAAHDTLTEVAKAAPAVGVALTGATGAIDWSTISYITVCVYTVLQIVLLLPKYRGWWASWRAKS
jgi:hypothetical protein